MSAQDRDCTATLDPQRRADDLKPPWQAYRAYLCHGRRGHVESSVAPPASLLTPEDRDFGIHQLRVDGASPPARTGGLHELPRLLAARPVSTFPSEKGDPVKNQTLNTTATATDSNTPATMLDPVTLIEQVRALRQQIPEFTHLPSRDKQALSRAASLHPDFVQGAITVVGASTGVQDILGSTLDALHQQTDDATRWATAEDEVKALLDGIHAANLVRKHRIGLVALQAYAIGRQLVPQKEHAGLLPHVEELQRLNRIGKRAKKTTPAGPATPSTPSTQAA